MAAPWFYRWDLPRRAGAAVVQGSAQMSGPLGGGVVNRQLWVCETFVHTSPRTYGQTVSSRTGKNHTPGTGDPSRPFFPGGEMLGRATNASRGVVPALERGSAHRGSHGGSARRRRKTSESVAASVSPISAAASVSASPPLPLASCVPPAFLVHCLRGIRQAVIFSRRNWHVLPAFRATPGTQSDVK